MYTFFYRHIILQMNKAITRLTHLLFCQCGCNKSTLWLKWIGVMWFSYSIGNGPRNSNIWVTEVVGAIPKLKSSEGSVFRSFQVSPSTILIRCCCSFVSACVCSAHENWGIEKIMAGRSVNTCNFGIVVLGKRLRQESQARLTAFSNGSAFHITNFYRRLETISEKNPASKSFFEIRIWILIPLTVV